MRVDVSPELDAGLAQQVVKQGTFAARRTRCLRCCYTCDNLFRRSHGGTATPTLQRPSNEEIKNGLSRALAELAGRDAHLLLVDANERSVSHHLARYLAEQFNGWDVDVEYNRNCDATDFIKRLSLNPPSTTAEDTDAVTVFPDIIVHRRGSNRDNLLVVEVKKAGRGDHRFDHEKLAAFTRRIDAGGLGYELGAHVVLAVEQVANRRDGVVWFSGGGQQWQ